MVTIKGRTRGSASLVAVIAFFGLMWNDGSPPIIPHRRILANNRNPNNIDLKQMMMYLDDNMG